MRAWKGLTLAWFAWCVTWMVGCGEPITIPATPAPSDTNPEAAAARPAQAVHHARQQVSPVLTWRENPSPTIPMALTASDGTGLDLVALKARVVIEDPLAFTELHLTFDNPENRRREGRFEIELPPEAALSRLSMKIRGEFQEGEVVERAKAQRTYETFMHRRPKVDPALLENDAGNRVRARVFPIAPFERKEIIVSFSQKLDRGDYRLPLQGLSTIEDFDARVVVKTHDPARDSSSLSGLATAQRVVEFQRTHFTPDKDLVVELDGADTAAGLHSGPLAIVRVQPHAQRPSTPPQAMLALLDTSASTGPGFEDRVERFGQAIAALAATGDFPLRLISFDQTAQTVYEGPASGLGIDALADVIEGRALGASDLEGAIAAAVAGARGQTWDRVLLVSDGIATAGATDRGELRAAVRTLESIGARRLDALAPQARLDRERLADLCEALPQSGAIIDDRAAADSIADDLGHAPFGEVAVSVEGASWSWPQTLHGVQTGQDVLIYAHFDGPRPSAVRVDFSDPAVAPQIVETLEVERPLVERAWVAARIDRIEHTLARLAPEATEPRTALDQRIVDLSTQFRVLNPRTALLVLETERDYRRFRIDRNGKADILTVDGGTIRVQRRSPTVMPAMPVAEDLASLEVALAAADEDLGLRGSSGWAPRGDDLDGDDGEDASAGTRHRGEEGRMGKPTEHREALARNEDEHARTFDPMEAAQRVLESSESGILGMVEQDSGHFLASPYGGAFDERAPHEDVYGGLTGTEIGETYGEGGLGLVGVGRGGGGTGEGTIGLGNTGLIGKGGGSGTGAGYGRGSGEGFGGDDDPIGSGRSRDEIALGMIGTRNDGLIGAGGSPSWGSSNATADAGFGRGTGAGFGGRGKRVPRVRQAQAKVQGSLDKQIIRRIMRAHVNEVRFCYNQGLARDPSLSGRVDVAYVISDTGTVINSVVHSSTIADTNVGACVTKAVRRWKFPKPTGGGFVHVVAPFVLDADEVGTVGSWSNRSQRTSWSGWGPPPKRHRRSREAHTGRFAEIQQLLAAGHTEDAYDLAWSWVQTQPGDTLGLLALGEALEQRQRPGLAARVYGSLIDLHPSRADVRRAAGQRLERLGEAGLALAVDSYAKAVAARPDQPSGARLHAWALVQQGRHAEAFDALDRALHRRYPSGRFEGVKSVLRQDRALVAAAWLASATGDDQVAARARIDETGITPAHGSSAHFVVTWETDTTDVDVILRAPESRRRRGRRVADVTTGFGPEARVLRGDTIPPRLRASVQYYEQGAMGHAMGTLHVISHDGEGGLTIQAAPFVLMQERGTLELGTFET